MTKSLIGLGSNLGDRAATLEAAVDALAAADDVRVISRSAWQLTLPVGVEGPRPEFLNGAALLETSREAADVHALLAEIETRFGRERLEKWGNRTLDLDLLLYGDSIVDTPTLTVPHPRMSFRRFVLEPTVEIAGTMIHPTIGWTLENLLEQLDAGADCVAVAAAEKSASQELIAKLVERFGLSECTPPVVEGQLGPPTSTTWLAVPNGKELTGRSKLSILLDLPQESEADRGPCLRVASNNGDELWREAFAAIEAVWPRLGSPGGERLQ